MIPTWHADCSLNSVILITGLAVGASAAIGLILHHLRNAPQGYEDDSGFHAVVAKPRSSASGVSKRSRQNEPVGTLRHSY